MANDGQIKIRKRILICPVDKHSVNDDKSQREALEASTSADFLNRVISATDGGVQKPNGVCVRGQFWA